jgi:hypothetical protein
MSKPVERPVLGDVENPVTMTDNDLKARLRNLGQDIGFGSRDTSVDASSAAPLPSAVATPVMQHAPTPTVKAEMDTLQIKIPRYLMQQLARAAVERRVTKKFIILESLKTCGYRITPEDLQEDGRRDRK